MALGTVTVGRMALSERYTLSDSVDQSGNQQLSLSGQEVNPGKYSLATLLGQQVDIVGLAGKVLPVVFSQKTSKNGFYRVDSATADLLYWQNEAAGMAWELTLVRVGADNAVDTESRLSGTARVNDFALAGVSWHSPPIGSVGYFTGSTQVAGAITRVGTDGNQTVYLTIPAGVAPRWGCDVGNYNLGRVRVLSDSIERSSVGFAMPPTTWELNNGLVRVVPLVANGQIEVSCWSGGKWSSPRNWHFARGGATTDLGTFTTAQVIQNDSHVCVIRCMHDEGTDRTIIDLTLRRGSRILEVYMQTGAATTLGMYLDVVEATNDHAVASGYEVATNDDADGNRYTCGSARAYTWDGVTCSMSKAATQTMDLWVGHRVGGGAAQAGDTAGDLQDQYIATLFEEEQVVTR